MRPSRTILLPVGFSLSMLAGCGGTGGATGTTHVRCAGSDSFCLVSCDLGCSSAGCSVTEVAENQRIQFVFNQDLAAGSVDVTSFSLRTAAGEPPLGDTIVDGPRVTFVPLVSVSNGVSTFGFRRNETYIITLLGGSERAIRSTAGDIMPRSFSCTITATNGIIDADNAKPRATLVAPTNLVAAPSNSTIVLRFSELIDATPFLTPVGPSTPIHYVLRQTRLPTGASQRICNPDSEAIPLEGLPAVGVETVNGRLATTVSLRPTNALPSLGCVEVQVTADVRDLAGKGAEEVTFRFITEAGVIVDTPLVEDFATPTRRDPVVSGGDWQNGAHVAVVGGDGRLGSFNHENGTNLGGGVFVWSTDDQRIPASQTFSGIEERVTSGEFFFSDLVVPANVTVRFQGLNPLKLHVRGKVEIRGILDASAPAMNSNFACRNPDANNVTDVAVLGQPGGAGGPGGASGGKGGDRVRQFATPPVVTPACNGANGNDLAMPAGHAYAALAVGTGGRGSPFHPATGIANIGNRLTAVGVGMNLFSSDCDTGGGGGGFTTAGGPGRAVSPQFVVLPPANAPGGVQLSLLPLPSPTPSSALHFFVGGSGGGGGGSHTFCGVVGIVADNFRRDIWRAGGAGTGGGGAMLLRAGGDLFVATTGSLRSNGGPGANYNGDNPNSLQNPDPVATLNFLGATSGSFGAPTPGGGGSGGTILVQAHGAVRLDGPINVAGSTGSHLTGMVWGSSTFLPLNIGDIRGGDGAPGFYRLESRTSVAVNSLLNVPAFNAAANNGPLQDRDSQSGSRSLWRASGAAFPPIWVRYEMQVDSNGDGTVDLLYSDDPAVPNSIGPANDPLGPVRVRFQGARVNSAGVPTTGTIRPWRDLVSDASSIGLNSDAATGFRFELIFNNALFPNAVVKRVTVIARS